LEFDEKNEMELIQTRYRRTLELFPNIINRLKRDWNFYNITQELIQRGYKEWHILSAIANQTMSWDFNQKHPRSSFSEEEKSELNEYKELIKQFFNKGEKIVKGVVPLTAFNLTTIEIQTNIFILNSLIQKGFRVRRRTPNFEKLREIINEKYKFFDLDIEHEQIFQESFVKKEHINAYLSYSADLLKNQKLFFPKEHKFMDEVKTQLLNVKWINTPGNIVIESVGPWVKALGLAVWPLKELEFTTVYISDLIMTEYRNYFIELNLFNKI